VARKRLTRKKVNDPIVDTALRDIYDKIEHLMPETSGKTSKRAPQVGDFQLVDNGDQTSLAQYTEEGWMVDMNSNYASVSNSKDFRPSVGSTGKSRTPVKGEAVRYDRNKNIAITNDKQEKVLLNNTGNELHVRNANNTADVKVVAKKFNVTGGTAAHVGDITHEPKTDSTSDIVKITTNNLFIPGGLTSESVQTAVTIQSNTNQDAVISLGDSTPNWVMGLDVSDNNGSSASGKFKIHATTDSTLPDAADFELDVDGNLVTAGTITDGSGNVLGADSSILKTGTSAPTSASDFSAGNGSMLWDTTTSNLYGLKNDGGKIFKWSGADYLDLQFNITSFGDNIVGNTILITNEGTSVNADLHFDCTFNNPSGGTFTGSISHSGETNSGQTGFPLSFTEADCVGSPLKLINFNDGSTINLLSPDNADSWTSGRKRQSFTLGVTDGSATRFAYINIDFKNKFFYGYSTQATALSNIPYSLNGGGDSFVATSIPTLAPTSITTSAADNYIWACYPSRLTGSAPTFKINGFATTFIENTNPNAANSASNAYIEEFKLWRSPNSYNNATLTLEIS
tara:strand:+ start:882 stop:2588 length:1707 start_codon:yes stop_codon:yes gene_type:complete